MCGAAPVSFLLCLVTYGARAVPLSSFYPFGNFALDASDDGHSSEIPLSTIFPFFGVNQTAVYVSKSARGYIKYVATVPTMLWTAQ